MHLNWADPALDDLDGIFAFIAKGAPDYAQSFVEQIMQAMERLYDFPKSGRIVPEAGREDVREVIFQGYRIMYWIVNDRRIDILTVLHSSRDINNPINQPWEVH